MEAVAARVASASSASAAAKPTPQVPTAVAPQTRPPGVKAPPWTYIVDVLAPRTLPQVVLADIVSAGQQRPQGGKRPHQVKTPPPLQPAEASPPPPPQVKPPHPQPAEASQPPPPLQEPSRPPPLRKPPPAEASSPPLFRVGDWATAVAQVSDTDLQEGIYLDFKAHGKDFACAHDWLSAAASAPSAAPASAPSESRTPSCSPPRQKKPIKVKQRALAAEAFVAAAGSEQPLNVKEPLVVAKAFAAAAASAPSSALPKQPPSPSFAKEQPPPPPSAGSWLFQVNDTDCHGFFEA